ncbi:MAG: RNA polymerase sigma factor [Acidothermaceae bacterium]
MTVEMVDEPFDDLLVAAQAGDEHAFACLWRDLNPRVLRYLRTMATSPNADLAADLASETWLQVIRHLPKFTGDATAFRAWVFTIARNKVVDNGRRERRRPRIESDDAPLDAYPATDDTAVLAVQNLTTDAALALIASLPREQAEVIMLRVVAGLDVAAVAKLVGKSPGAVRISAHRGLRRLQEIVVRPHAEVGSAL